MVKIYIRDCNGKRCVMEYKSPEAFVECYNNDGSDFDDELYEILMVVYDGVCVFSGLMSGNRIIFEDLIGFFA